MESKLDGRVGWIVLPKCEIDANRSFASGIANPDAQQIVNLCYIVG